MTPADILSPRPPFPIPRSPALATDLYQLTMAAAYHAHGMDESAGFELFVRHLPRNRSYLIAAGLQQVVDYLLNLRFHETDIAYLKSLEVFKHTPESFFDRLADFQFSGDLWAVPEGTPFFAGEPLLRVTAPVLEAQLVETYLLATINYQTMVATTASRMAHAAKGRGIIEFGSRRAHGTEAAYLGARAAFIGGAAGTSNLEAGSLFDIPVYGTSAHSWIMAFEREIDAFEAYHDVFPSSTTLLLDTYDTIEAAKKATAFGTALKGVRIDSGDIADDAQAVRNILDEAEMFDTFIMASGDLNEYKINALIEKGVPVDFFGVGSELITPKDAPTLGGVYKLVETGRGQNKRPVMKLSAEKLTYPYCKQVWRKGVAGTMAGDIISIADEEEYGSEYFPVLKPIIKNGRLIETLPDIKALQQNTTDQLNLLPDDYKTLENASTYPVQYSDSLAYHKTELTKRLSTH